MPQAHVPGVDFGGVPGCRMQTSNGLADMLSESRTWYNVLGTRYSILTSVSPLMRDGGSGSEDSRSLIRCRREVWTMGERVAFISVCLVDEQVPVSQLIMEVALDSARIQSYGMCLI